MLWWKNSVSRFFTIRTGSVLRIRIRIHTGESKINWKTKIHHSKSQLTKNFIKFHNYFLTVKKICLIKLFSSETSLHLFSFKIKCTWIHNTGSNPSGPLIKVFSHIVSISQTFSHVQKADSLCPNPRSQAQWCQWHREVKNYCCNCHRFYFILSWIMI